MPSSLYRHPFAVVQASEVDAVTDVPTAVTMVVLHAFWDWWIVVTVHAFDDALRIFSVDHLGGDFKKQFHIVALHEAVRLGTGGREWLVDERNEHVARVRAYEALHRDGLTNAFEKLVAPDGAEQRHISLQHQSQAIACFINLSLHRMLREA